MFLSEMMKTKGFKKAEDVFRLKEPATAEKTSYTIIASTPDIDRDGEIIEPSAYKNLDKYLNDNPLILWMHDPFSPPVGKAVGGKITDNSLELDIEFADTEFAQEIKSLYDGGYLNSFSVGGRVNKRANNEKGIPVIQDMELWEVSCVTLPSNRSANMIREAKAMGLDIPHVEKALTVLDDVETQKQLEEAKKNSTLARVPDPEGIQEPTTHEYDHRGWW